MAEKWVYAFGGGTGEGSRDMRNLLGGKGANLAEMARLGLPVPPGFTITTDVCAHYYARGESYPPGLEEAVNGALKTLEEQMNARFGDADNPLLVSVRSGARVSMPGMMDTVLNLGLNDAAVEGLAKKSGDARFAWDSYRRFIQMYSDVVLGVDHHLFEDVIETYKRRNDMTQDVEIPAEGWQDMAGEFRDIVRQETGKDFPQDPHAQLWGAIGAVFGSWKIPRAVKYRQIHNIPEDWGTAVNVQTMVFGNMGTDCATGVAFTRDPSTGENIFYGEYLINAQGEDVVAGIRTPRPLDQLRDDMPEAYRQLEDVRVKLETHYRDMQDIEFTIQRDTLYMLQTRSGKRTGAAALKIAVDMTQEGILSREEAVTRVDPAALDQLLHPRLDPAAVKNIIATGLPASPGAAAGALVFTADEAERRAGLGESIILARTETSPEDIHGMHAAKGILTSRGGMTSHAAVVARGMGRPCVAGAGDLAIDSAKGEMIVGDTVYREGDWITLDGAHGHVIAGHVATLEPELSGNFTTLMGWADEFRRLRVRTNADTPDDAATARKFGAEGIGLCRTEHMFFDPDRIGHVRAMILAGDDEAMRNRALEALEPVQKADFKAIFKAMDGLPVTIRLLDPPLHEFLPHDAESQEQCAAYLGRNIDTLRRRITQLQEFNPMLGHRGCRLGISHPSIYDMQIRAILGAAAEARQEGVEILPEIMIPLIMSAEEFRPIAARIQEIAAEIADKTGTRPQFLTGTMIELPRAALRAGDIAETAEFFSFGTNDLTQTAMGLSRDDSGHFLPLYIERGLLERDPFAALDQNGVGELVEIAVERGRKIRGDLKLGICGEHGGDPDSIGFFDRAGLDYVSCSPYRVPIARLAAAQSAIRAEKDKTVTLEPARAASA